MCCVIFSIPSISLLSLVLRNFLVYYFIFLVSFTVFFQSFSYWLLWGIMINFNIWLWVSVHLTWVVWNILPPIQLRSLPSPFCCFHISYMFIHTCPSTQITDNYFCHPQIRWIKMNYKQKIRVSPGIFTSVLSFFRYFWLIIFPLISTWRT